MTDNVISIGLNGKYSDFRVLVRDLMEKYPNVKDGIIILFEEDGSMLVKFVCKKSYVAFAAADLLYKAGCSDMEPV